MTRTLYDPEVEKRGIEKGIEKGKAQGIEEGIEKGKAQGIEEGIEKAKIENAKNLLDILDDETIAIKIGLDIEVVRKLRVENK